MSNTQSSCSNPFIDADPLGTAEKLVAILEFVAAEKFPPGLRLILSAARNAAVDLRDALALEADDARVDAAADLESATCRVAGQQGFAAL